MLNRFSRDCDIVDIILNMNFRIALFTAARTIAAIVIIAIDTPFVLLAVLPLGLLYFVLQKMYLPTSRQLRRIESTTRSPIYSHFGESLNGSSTIRAFGKQTQFIIETNRRIDQNNVASYAINGCTQWIITRLEFLGHMASRLAYLIAGNVLSLFVCFTSGRLCKCLVLSSTARLYPGEHHRIDAYVLYDDYS